MKKLALVLIIAMAFCACATVDRSVIIDTDKTDSYASGQYRDSHYGQLGTWGFWFLGGYSGPDAATSSGPPWFVPCAVSRANSDPTKFARSIAMINYSKKLKSIKYDETEGIIEYEFEHKPIGKVGYQPSVTKPTLPSSFGHQPIE